MVCACVKAVWVVGEGAGVARGAERDAARRKEGDKVALLLCGDVRGDGKLWCAGETRDRERAGAQEHRSAGARERGSAGARERRAPAMRLSRSLATPSSLTRAAAACECRASERAAGKQRGG